MLPCCAALLPSNNHTHTHTARAVEGRLAEKFPACARKVYSYLKRTQIAADEKDREKYFRHISKGGWPFSTAAHGFASSYRPTPLPFHSPL